MKKEKGISLIKSADTHGLYVRAYTKGRTVGAKFFSFSKHHTKRECQEAAVAYRDALVRVVDRFKKSQMQPNNIGTETLSGLLARVGKLKKKH